MAILPIVTYDDDILREEAQPVTEDSEELQALVDDMFETMYNADGVGLAAPQVGKLLRVFVADVDPMIEQDERDIPKYGPLAMINPEIVETSAEELEMEEGCLSIPGVNAAVKRAARIKVRYLDRDFKEQELDLDGWPARVVQHEKDHLDGVLFLEHLSFFKQKLLSAKLNEIAKGQKETEYPLAPKTQLREKG
ncbi:peptide deformylase [Halalkalibaculum sp. DA3122]|uniref:peptide deformylase n=1 Tax=Halalkalibaculum sp. DA3122 TaxID=3373607 RepID=UPI00375513DE